MRRRVVDDAPAGRHRGVTASRTDAGGQLTGIQYLRGIAATMVVVHHTLEESYGATASAWRAPDWLTTFGAAGVDIFFVISGLVMLHASFRGDVCRDAPLRFLARRALRIFPLYWLCLVGLVACWAMGFYRTLDPNALFLLRNALLWPGERLALGVSWTLSYEFYFYLIFALMLVLRTRMAAVLGTLAVLAFGLIVARILPATPASRLIGNPIVLEFALGLGLALLVPRLRRDRMLGWLSVPAFAALMVSPLMVAHATTNELPMPARLILWGLPGAVIVAAFIAVGPAPERLHKGLKLLGDASYSIYLTHPFGMLAYAWALRRSEMLRETPQVAIVLMVVAGCMVLGITVHRLVERPLLSRLTLRRDHSGRTDTTHGGAIVTPQATGI